MTTGTPRINESTTTTTTTNFFFFLSRGQEREYLSHIIIIAYTLLRTTKFGQGKKSI